MLTILLAFGFPEWGLIVLAVLLLFGGRKIPELMKGMGKGIKEFKSATSDSTKEEIEESTDKEKND